MTWCVEMRYTGAGGGWIVLPSYGKLGPLAGITRDEAVDRASRLPRCGGEYAYRVRPDR